MLPKGIRAAFEFRHQSWFDDETFAVLRENGAALCVADADDGLEVPVEPTADWGYVRLRREKYTGAQLMSWAERIKKQKWREAFVFFKHEDVEGTGPTVRGEAGGGGCGTVSGVKLEALAQAAFR